MRWRRSRRVRRRFRRSRRRRSARDSLHKPRDRCTARDARRDPLGYDRAVSLNGVNDYFGQTVNIAARVRRRGRLRVLRLSRCTEDQRASAALERVLNAPQFNSLEDRALTLKGVERLFKREALRIQGQLEDPRDVR